MATGFDEDALAHLRSQSLSLGATFADDLPRVPPQAGLVVLAPRPMGTAKFLVALAWGVPPVRDAWLEHTARHGVPANAAQFSLALRSPGVLRRGWHLALQPLRYGMLQSRNVTVLLKGSIAFRDAWTTVLKMAGAVIVASYAGCRYVVTEMSPLILTTSEGETLDKVGAEVVSAEWVKTCLENQCEVTDLEPFRVPVETDRARRSASKT